MSETATALLPSVKLALNITGSYQDETIAEYIDEVVAFLKEEQNRKNEWTNDIYINVREVTQTKTKIV